MKGRKPIPKHLKIVSGTYRADRDSGNAPEVIKGPMTAPAWLNERATQIFCAIAKIMEESGTASPSYDGVVSLLAARLDEIETLTVTIDDYGRFFESTSAKGGLMIRSHPSVGQRSDAMRHAQSLFAEIGLTPAAINKVVSAISSGDKNPFDEF